MEAVALLDRPIDLEHHFPVKFHQLFDVTLEVVQELDHFPQSLVHFLCGLVLLPPLFFLSCVPLLLLVISVEFGPEVLGHFVVAFALPLQNPHALLVSSVIAQILEPVSVHVPEQPLHEHDMVLEHASRHLLE